jgi:hypothetical protein
MWPEAGYLGSKMAKRMTANRPTSGRQTAMTNGQPIRFRFTCLSITDRAHENEELALICPPDLHRAGAGQRRVRA